MDRSAVIVKNPGAASRTYDGRAMVVLPDQAEVDVLNEIGSLVWDRIDGKRTLGDLVEAVVEEYDVTPEEAERDVRDFIASLQAHGMVR